MFASAKAGAWNKTARQEEKSRRPRELFKFSVTREAKPMEEFGESDLKVYLGFCSVPGSR